MYTDKAAVCILIVTTHKELSRLVRRVFPQDLEQSGDFDPDSETDRYIVAFLLSY